MSRLYDLVTRHFIASVSQDAVWTSTKVELQIDVLEEQGKGQGSFSLSGKELKEPGWLAVVMHKQYGDKEEGDELEDEEEKALPEFIKGELVPLFSASSQSSSGGVNMAPSSASYASLDVKERMTTPPGYLTESELISKMEANGIGTDASIGRSGIVPFCVLHRQWGYWAFIFSPSYRSNVMIHSCLVFRLHQQPHISRIYKSETTLSWRQDDDSSPQSSASSSLMATT